MPAGRGLESRGHEEEVHMDIYMAHTFVETGVATGPSPGTNVEMMYPNASLLVDEDDTPAPMVGSNIPAPGVPSAPALPSSKEAGFPSPGAEELKMIRNIEAKLQDHGWHDAMPQPVVGKVVPSAAAFARMGASVEAVIADAERDENSLARCQNCAKWFPALDTTEGGKGCTFHPGVYKNTGTTLAGSFYVGWSCCKEMDEKCGGCKSYERHVEDVSMTACMRGFKGEGDPVAAAEMEKRVREAAEQQAEEDAKAAGAPYLSSSDEEDDEEGNEVAEVAGGRLATGVDTDADGNILHHVRPMDTLQGLSLRYGVSTQRIKEVNCIMGSTIIQYGTLVIPSNPTGKCAKRSLNKATEKTRRRPLEATVHADLNKQRLQTALQRDMCQLGGGCPEEAKAYLELADGDLEEAMRMYRQDLAWEKSNPVKFPGQPPVFVNMNPKSVISRAKGLLKSLSSGAISVP